MGRGSGELRTGGEKWFGSPVSSVRGIWIRGGWVGGRRVKLNGIGWWFVANDREFCLRRV